MRTATRERTATIASREAAIVDYLRARDLDAVLTFSDGFHYIGDSSGPFAISGFRPLGSAMCAFDRDGRSTLAVEPAWDGERARAHSRTTHVRATDSLASVLAAMLRDHDARPGRVVTVGLDRMPRRLVDPVAGLLGGSSPSDDGFVERLAAVRTPEEIEQVRRAAAIAERGYARLLEVCRPGIREYELAGEIVSYMRALGGEDNFLLLSASLHHRAGRAPGRRVIEAGDTVLTEITPTYCGQTAQICRTVSVGEPGAALRDVYALFREASAAGREAARAGNRVSDICAAMDAQFVARGYGDYCRPPFMRVRGHGLGFTSASPGLVSAQNHMVLEEGMSFVVHPNQYLPGTGYVMCGDTIVIGRERGELLLDCESELGQVPA